MKYIEKLLQRAIDEAAEGNVDFCVLLESKSDEKCWVQLTWDSINVAYPFKQKPLRKLEELGIETFAGIEVSQWKPGLFATFGHGADVLKEMAVFVASYFELALGVSPARKEMRIEEQQL